MDNFQFIIYLLIMAGSTYLIRAVPFAAVSKKINNTFIRSFLYYIPYTVLTAMTFPAALYATNSMISAALGLAVAIGIAIWKMDLTIVAVAACFTVFVSEYVIGLL